MKRWTIDGDSEAKATAKCYDERNNRNSDKVGNPGASWVQLIK